MSIAGNAGAGRLTLLSRATPSVTRPSGWLLGGAMLVSAAGLLPIAFILGVTGSLGWPTVIALVFRPRVAELLANTLLLVALVVPLAIALGVALAWLTERTTLPGRRLWALLVTAPLAVPAFVQSYAWVSLAPSLHGLVAAVLVSVLAYFPFLYLPVAAALRRLDPGLEDVAASLGVTPWSVFRRVVLPQLRLAIIGGALLVGLHLLAEYGLYAMIRFDTFTTAIFDQFQSTFNGPAANMLAGILGLCCLSLLSLDAVARGRARYARLGSGSARMPPARRHGPWVSAQLLLLPASVTVLALGVPIATLVRWLAIGGSAVWQGPDLAAALAQTIELAGIGAVMTTLAAIPMAWLAVRSAGRLVRALEACNYVTSSLPGIVVALALVTITVKVAHPLYQTLVTVLLAYLLMFLPRALISLRASIAQAPAELEEVAAALGRSPGRTLWTVTMRLAAPGASAGAALVFIAITNELTATLLLAPNGTRTLATAFWALSSEIDYAAAAPYALFMVLLSLPLTGMLYRQSRHLSGR
jgi:iron(III) transport system permease protein